MSFGMEVTTRCAGVFRLITTTRIGRSRCSCSGIRSTPIDGIASADPIEGGCANNYTYVYGDPINKSDLTGKWWILDDIWNGVKEEVSDDVWHATLGKAFTCDNNGVTQFIETFGFVRDLNRATVAESAPRYVAVNNVGVTLGAPNYLIKVGTLEVSTALAAKVASAATAYGAVTTVATVHQVSRRFLC